MELLQRCMDEENFCDECCNFSSGVTFNAEIDECAQKCDDAIKSKIEPEMTVSMQFTVNKNRNNQKGKDG